ncbi:MAG: hypothetical protein ACLFWL_19245 [Candidatus Brocadiia bacterium]
MGKKLWVIIVVAVVFVAIGFWIHTAKRYEQEHPGRDQSELNGAETHVPTSVSDRRATKYSELAEAPAIEVSQTSKQQLAKRYVGLKGARGKIEDSCIEMLQQNECPYHYLYDRQTKTYVQGHFGAPLDIPKVEIRFRKRDADGDWVPHPVQWVITYPVWDGRSHPPREKEHFQAMHVTSIAGLEENAGAHASRFFLSDDPRSGEYDSLVFGQTYYVEFLYPGYYSRSATPDLYGSALIQMPEKVARGKVAVFTVNVSKRIEGWGRPGDYSDPKTQVKIHVRDAAGMGRLGVSLYDPSKGYSLFTRLSKDGKGELGVYELGGEASVDVLVKPDVTFFLYYKGKVTKKKVVFPKDADVIVDPKDIITFKLKVPRKKVPEDCIAMGLLLHRDSKLSVGGAEFDRDAGWSGPAEGDEPETLTMLAPPRSYYVAYDVDDPTVIGKITVKKSDAGKTLEVEQLEE